MELSMSRFVSSSTSLAALLLFPAHIASAEEAAPKGNVGFSTVKSQVIDLGPEIDGMEGRQLRMRILRIEPGGHIGIHNHINRPAVVYAIKGVDTVTLGDGEKVVLEPGDMGQATKATTHWHKNDGTEDVLLVAVDIFQPKK
jgi:quercetin dioxygenase-like cupin family protein